MNPDFGHLRIEVPGQPPMRVELKLGANTLGREPGCDILIPAEGVSRRHARIVCTPRGALVTDLESRNGTFLNQVRLQPNVPQQLKSGDRLQLGTAVITYSTDQAPSQALPQVTGARPQAVPPKPPAQRDHDPVRPPAPDAQQPYLQRPETVYLVVEIPGQPPVRAALRPGGNTVGADPTCDIPIPIDGVGRRHARIVCTPHMSEVTDLGSQAGTLLNDERLQPNAPQPLVDGDRLQIGAATLRYAVVQPYPPRNTRSRYLELLPPIYDCAPESFFNNFMLIFESVLDPLERTVGQLHYYLDPCVAPEPVLSWLAAWVGIATTGRWPEARRRELIERATELYRWRGTRQGLSEYLQIYTAVAPQIFEPWQKVELGQGRSVALGPSEFLVLVDASASQSHWVTRETIVKIIEATKPVHTAYVLEYRPPAAQPSGAGDGARGTPAPAGG